MKRKIYNIFKTAVINLIICLSIFAVFEFMFFMYAKCVLHTEKYRIEKFDYRNMIKYYPTRPVSGIENPGRPIIIAGCSHAYGFCLEENQTLGYKLSLLSNRPVYNIAIPGKGFQNTLFQIQNRFFDESLKSPEYIIYLFIDDHFRRMYNSVCADDYIGQPVYKLTKDGRMSLVSENFPVYRQLYIVHFVTDVLYRIFEPLLYKHNMKLAKAYLRTMRDEISEIYPGIKFVVLVYGTKVSPHFDFYESEDDGFIVLGTNEITNENLFSKEFQISDTNLHPNEKAWDTIAPALNKCLEKF